MRVIKFRGKRLDNSEWVYGDLLQPTEICDIYEISDCNSFDGSRYEIIASTIGQYTGRKDKYGNEIYEGDIIKLSTKNLDYTIIGDIIYDIVDCAFEIRDLEDMDSLEMLLYEESEFEVLGTIYDNV